MVVTSVISSSVFVLIYAFQPVLYHVFDAPTYLVLHTILELASILVSFSIFVVNWHASQQRPNSEALIIGVGFLAVAAIDTLHMMSFPGMPKFFTDNSTQKGIVYWLSARLVESLSVLGAALLAAKTRHRLPYRRRLLLLWSACLVVAVFIINTFYPQLVPAMFVEGIGLTPLKVAIEYVIIALALAAISVLWQPWRKSGRAEHSLPVETLVAALILIVFSELAFTLYKSAYDSYNLLGHFYKVVAYYLVFRALFVTSIERPYRELAASEAEQSQLRDTAERKTLQLLAVGQLIHAPFGLHDRLQSVADGARELLGVECVAILLCDEATGAFRIAATAPRQEQESRKDFRLAENVGFDLGPRHSLVLDVEGNTFGKIEVYTDKEEAPPPEQLDLLRAFADAATAVLRDAKSHEEIQRLLCEVKGREERLEAQNDELRAQSQEINRQSEELTAQNEELLSANESLVEAQKALGQSESRFRSLIENAPVGISVLRNGITILTNHSSAKMFGYLHVSEMEGSVCWDRVAPPFRAAVERATKAAGDLAADTREIVALRKDGSEFNLSLQITRMELPDGPAAVAFFADITERKRAEEELRTARDELESRVRERTVDLAKAVDSLRIEIAERERAQERVQLQLDHLAALRPIDDAIKSTLDVNVTARIILEQVTERLAVHAADLMLLNQRSKELEFIAERGFRSQNTNRSRMAIAEGLISRVLSERRTIRVTDLPGEVDAIRASLIVGEDFVSYFGVPLIAKGQVKGILEIYHRASLDPSTEWLNFMETLAGQAAIAIDNAALFDELQRFNFDLSVAYDTTIEGWSRALDLRDKETEGHSRRVTDITLRLAHSLGMSDSALTHVRRGSLLHDIGKVGIPDNVLLKPGPLDADERAIMNKHPIYAHELLWPIPYLRPALDIPYCHHEKWDGTGYPRGLRGDAIPLAARIFAVADIYDALRSDRPYRPAWPVDRVREHLAGLSSSHIDPMVAQSFLELEL